jgi:hypothetical protein
MVWYVIPPLMITLEVACVAERDNVAITTDGIRMLQNRITRFTVESPYKSLESSIITPCSLRLPPLRIWRNLERGTEGVRAMCD